MTNKEWLQLINAKREAIIEAGEQAFKDSVDNQHLHFTVELYDDGDVDVWHQTAGGNNHTMSSHNGSSMAVMSFCNQYLETQVQDSQHIERAKEKGIEIPEVDDDDNDITEDYERVSWLNENHIEIIQECESEWLEWYKDEYAYQEADSKLDAIIDELKRQL